MLQKDSPPAVGPNCTFSEGRTAIDPKLVDRIKAAYRAANQSKASLGNSIWSYLNDRKKDVHDALMSDDDSLKGILLNPGATDLFWGFDDLSRDNIALIRRDPRQFEASWSARLMAYLLSLSEAVGARRRWNPEQPKAEGVEPAPADVNQLLDVIENRIGVAIEFPNPFPDEYGIPTKCGIASYRSIQALYQAWRLRELTRSHGTRILEIGGGMGRTACFAHKFGLHDYSIVDIPMTAVSQAAFLGRVLGLDHVSLSHEKPRRGAIRLLHPAQLGHAGFFDIVFNSDGLTEMDESVAQGYAKFIRNHSRAFLSLNHEVNRYCVRDLFNSPSVYRCPHWIRDGYVEELYLFHQPLRSIWRRIAGS